MRWVLVISMLVLDASTVVASSCKSAISEFLVAAPDVRVSDEHSISGAFVVVNLKHQDVPRLHLTCYDARATLHADWPDGVPDSRYWTTLARLGVVSQFESI